MCRFISRMVAAVAVLAMGSLASAQGSFIRIQPGETHTFTAIVNQGMPTQIIVRSNDDSQRELQCVVSPRGHFSDEDDTDQCSFTFLPPTGLIMIRVTNVGLVPQYYTLEVRVGGCPRSRRQIW
jgi:hypothetical protein